MEHRTFRVIKTGLVDYERARALQFKLLDRKLSGESRDFLVLSEHKPVITLGRGFKQQNLLLGKEELNSIGVSVLDTERGGDATYHGPGQLVGYPVFDLARRGRDIRLFIQSIEEAIIGTLKDFNISSGRKKGSIGVWAGGKKIASIGVAVRKWISYHGFALNIFTDLKNFSFINPCGLDYNVMTSMENILEMKVPADDVADAFIRNFSDVCCTFLPAFGGGEDSNA